MVERPALRPSAQTMTATIKTRTEGKANTRLYDLSALVLEGFSVSFPDVHISLLEQPQLKPAR